MNWKGSVAITLIGAYAGAHAAHVKQQLHTTGTTGASVIIAPDVSSGVSWGLFRAQQPMPVEILHDNVSQHWPTALVALTMDETELRRLLVARRYDPQDERPHRRSQAARGEARAT